MLTRQGYFTNCVVGYSCQNEGFQSKNPHYMRVKNELLFAGGNHDVAPRFRNQRTENLIYLR